MSTTVLRPTDNAGNNWTLVGTGDVDAVLSDDLDANYATVVGENDLQSLLTFTEPSLAAGSALVRGRLRARAKYIPVGWSGTAYFKPWYVLGASGAEVLVPPFTESEVTILTFALSEFPGTLLVNLGIVVPDSGVDARLYELYLDIVYATKPNVTVTDPTGTLTTDNRPTVEWTHTVDADGGNVTHFEAKIFSSAQYGAGGFAPGSSTPTDGSGETEYSGSRRWRGDARLADGTYRAYVRIAQTVNGELHWGDWDNEQFIVDAPNPGIPSLVATADDADARVELELVAEGTSSDDVDANSDLFQVQRSTDGGTTWKYLRTELGDGKVDIATATVYDYEGGNGETVHYRARAISEDGSLESTSDWDTDSAAWTSAEFWLKHPTRPSLNMAVDLASFQDVTAEARQGVFQPVGSASPIVIADVRGGSSGAIKFWLTSDTEREDFDALIEDRSPLLLQGRPGDENFPDRWVALGEKTRSRLVDRAGEARSSDELGWVEVNEPEGNLAE